jgi:hypothetical protein
MVERPADGLLTLLMICIGESQQKYFGWDHKPDILRPFMFSFC